MSIDLGSLALGWLGTYGSPMVSLILFIGELGVPMPGTLIIVASGAFIRQGLLDLYSTPLLGLFGAVVGDLTLYGIASFAGGWINKRFGDTSAWKSAQAFFEKRGGAAIFFSRWLLTAIAFPITLIAATSGYRFRKFSLYVLAGEAVWVAIYGGVGYYLGAQWELFTDFVSNFGGFVFGGLAFGAGVYLLFKFGKKKPASLSINE